jgi:nucleotide-binding universal stress UspA family protein
MRSILVAVDGSRRAPAVYQTALAFAKQFDATLHVFRAIVVPQDFPPAAPTRREDELPHQMEGQATEELRAMLGSPPSRVLPPVLRFVSQAWRAILAIADELDVDLIVLGSHGYEGLDRILGTTAGKVVNHAKRNVLVVHRHP